MRKKIISPKSPLDFIEEEKIRVNRSVMRKRYEEEAGLVERRVDFYLEIPDMGISDFWSLISSRDKSS